MTEFLVRVPMWGEKAEFSSEADAWRWLARLDKAGVLWELYERDEGAWSLTETGGGE